MDSVQIKLPTLNILHIHVHRSALFFLVNEGSKEICALVQCCQLHVQLCFFQFALWLLWYWVWLQKIGAVERRIPMILRVLTDALCAPSMA